MLTDFDESDIEESLNSLRLIAILFIHSWPHTVAPLLFLFLSSSPSHVSFFIFPILPEWPASRKTKLQKNYVSAFGALSTLRNTRGFLEILFTGTLTVANFPCTDWLNYLRTQLKVFVGGVCLQSRRFFLALFSRIIFLPETDTLKSYNSKGICSAALKFGQ